MALDPASLPTMEDIAQCVHDALQDSTTWEQDVEVAARIVTLFRMVYEPAPERRPSPQPSDDDPHNIMALANRLEEGWGEDMNRKQSWSMLEVLDLAGEVVRMHEARKLAAKGGRDV